MNPIIPHSKPTLTSRDKAVLLKVIQSNMIAAGDKTAEFGNRVADYLGLKYGVATSSGSAALFLSLKALCIGKGDEVILPTYVCYTVLSAVEKTGAVPVLCDVGDDWVISYDTVKPHISSKTKAIIAPHIGGIAIDIEPLTELEVPVIEDLAQAFGAQINGRKAGTFGKIAICSFKGIKCLATGEGGMVISNDNSILKRIRSVQIFSPMSDIQAALGISQLEQYDLFLQRRREIADFYFKTFDRFPGICMPLALRKRSMFFRFPLITPLSFDLLKDEFEKKGVAVRKFIDFLLHRVLKKPSKNFPNAEKHFKETFSIPIYPSLSKVQIKYIAKVGVEILSKYLQ
jgi:UDP-4-amino-4-deoxy-L-arabinose-oxoglutarate aminotransferase